MIDSKRYYIFEFELPNEYREIEETVAQMKKDLGKVVEFHGGKEYSLHEKIPIYRHKLSLDRHY